MATDTANQSASACVDAGGSAIGMPQLCSEWMGNQIFWLLITLAAIYFVLSRVALPRIAAVLAERQGTITNDIAKAEDLKRQAEDAEAAYDKALKDARAEAQRIAAETKAEMQEQMAEESKKADAEIAAKASESEKAINDIRASAMENVEAVAKDTARALVVALGGREDGSAIDQAVDQRLKG